MEVVATNPARSFGPLSTLPSHHGVDQVPSARTSRTTGRTIPRMLNSPFILNSVAPTRLATLPRKRISGCRSTSRKSGDLRCASRCASPVHTARASMTASTDAESGSSLSKIRLPCTFLNCPRTQVTIMWRAQNSADVWPGSKNHFAMRPPFAAPFYQEGRGSPASQHRHGVYPGRGARGQEAGREGNGGQRCDDRRVRERVALAHPEEEGGEKARQRQRSEDAQADAAEREAGAACEDEPRELPRLRPSAARTASSVFRWTTANAIEP